jgi:hypothetical protein
MDVTTAVTGPPPKSYDFKTRVTGGSRSPHGSVEMILPWGVTHVSIFLLLDSCSSRQEPRDRCSDKQPWRIR